MLQPKKRKYRKDFRGRMKGKATRGATLAFGEYGIFFDDSESNLVQGNFIFGNVQLMLSYFTLVISPM